MSIEDIVTNEDAVYMHGGSNFGHMSPRDVINDGVVKVHLGYHCGSLQQEIIYEHGLSTKHCDLLTEKGKEYLAALLSNHDMSTYLKTPVKRSQ